MGEFGRDVAAKIRDKYDPSREQEALDWIGELVGQESPQVIGSDGDALYTWLKNGVFLCQVLNVIRPGTIPRIVARPQHVLEERQNIQAYLSGCRTLGIPGQDLFDVGDLHSRTMIPAVLQNIFAVGRQAQVIPTYSGPQLGSKFSVSLEEQARRKQKLQEENDRRANFIRAKSEQQLLRRVELEGEQRKDEIKKIGHTRQRSLTRQLSKGRISLTEFEQLSDQTDKEMKDLEQSEDDLGVQATYGLDLEIKKKVEAKYDTDREEQVMDWIESVTGTKLSIFYDDLKNGITLCKMVNVFRPKIISRINTRDTALAHRDNIQMYLTACARIGLQPSQLFSPSDLYEKRDLNAVVNHFFSLSQRVEFQRLWKGPFLQRDGTLGEGRMSAIRAQSSPQFLGEQKKSLSCAALPVPKKKLKDMRFLGEDLSPVKPPLENGATGSSRDTVKPSVRFESPVRKRTNSVEIIITPESPAQKPSPAPRTVPSPARETSGDLASLEDLDESEDDTIEFDRPSLIEFFFPSFWISNLVDTVSNLGYMFLRG